MIDKSKFKSEGGFVFTATATVVSVILGLTILFMTNTIRTESVRTAELHSAQDAYWQAVADVQMAATLIQHNGTSILPHIGTYFPNITITQIDQTNMTIRSDVAIGSTTAGAQRSISIDITSPLFTIIENVSHEFDLTGFSRVDGGNLYIGGDVDIKSFWFFKLAYIGQDSTVHFYLPTGSTVDPSTPQGGDDYTVTNVSPISLPGFDDSAYQQLLNYASGISVDNPAAGEFIGTTKIDGSTFPSGLDLQTVGYTGGGILSGLGNGIFVNGKLEIDGTTSSGTTIIDNNTASNPGFIVVTGKIEIKGDWFLWLPTFLVPDNIIIIANGKVELEYTNIGESSSYPPSSWPNYVNEIYTQGSLQTSKWTFGSELFGQFHVLGSASNLGWISKTSGVLYAPNGNYDMGSWFTAFPEFNGTFYLNRTKHSEISWFADVNLDSRARLGRGLPGGLIQPSEIPWIILQGSLREI